MIELTSAAFTGAGELELRRADLCRERLLVEIEGLAELDG